MNNIIEILMNIVVGNSNKLQKMGLEGKFNWMHSKLGQWHKVH